MTDKQIFKVADIESAVATLLRHPSMPPLYSVVLQGVKVKICEQSFELSIYIPYQGMHRLKGTKALDWIAEACREKVGREAVS